MDTIGSALSSFPVTTLWTLAGIYLASATVSGLSGFGFSAIGALTLCVVPPQFGVCMLMLLSAFTQAMSIGSLRSDMRMHNADWRQGFLPYAVGGVVGLPVGLEVLIRAPSQGVAIGLGSLLLAYSAFGLLKKASPARLGRPTGLAAAFAVGAVGGVLGGASALPACALVMWNGLKDVPKERARALTQPFTLFMQIVALVIVGVTRPALFDARLLVVLALALPLAWAGNRLGVKLYRRASDLNYRSVTLVAFGLSGVSLLVKTSVFA